MLTGTGDTLICCSAQFAQYCNLLVTMHFSCKFRNQSAPLNWKQCSASTTEQQLCWGCTVTITHSVSKVQQHQLNVAAFFTRSFTAPMARSTCPLLWGYLCHVHLSECNSVYTWFTQNVGTAQRVRDVHF